MGRMYDPRSRNLGKRFHGRGAVSNQTVNPLSAFSTSVANNPSIVANQLGVFPGSAISTSVANVPTITQNVNPSTAVSTSTANNPTITVPSNAAVVQSTQLYTGIAKAFASNNTAGNCLVAIVTFNDATGLIDPTISDTQGNTWTRLALKFNSAGSPTSVKVAYAPNCAAGANTVTFAGGINATTNDAGIIIMELSGIKASPTAVQSANIYSGGAITAVSVNITTTVKSALIGIFADEAASQGSITEGSGFTTLQRDTTHAHSVEFKAGVASGSPAVNFTLGGGSGAFIVDAVALEEA